MPDKAHMSKKFGVGVALLWLVYPSAASAWCGRYYWLPAKAHLVQGTPSIAEHYEWVVGADHKFRRGPLIKKAFVAKLWKDGRFQLTGGVANSILHRKLEVSFTFRARWMTGHTTVREWNDIVVGPVWYIGKGKKGRPRVQVRDKLGQGHALSDAQFAMIGDPQYEVAPNALCWVT